MPRGVCGVLTSLSLFTSRAAPHQVSSMAPFNSESFPNCLALTSEAETVIGTVGDNQQRLHVQTIPMNEQPRRIAYHASSACFAVATVMTALEGGEEVRQCATSQRCIGTNTHTTYDC